MSTPDPTLTNVRTAIANKTTNETVFVLVALGLGYGFFYLPELVVTFFGTQFHSIGALLTSMGLAGVGGGIAGRFIGSGDSLATTNLKSARFFRAQYPSEEIKKRYSCDDQGKADELWFKYIFNPWEEKTHPQHAQYVMTFERSYGCRFIFYVRWALVLITLLAAITWFISWKFGFESVSDSAPYTREYARGFLLAMAVLIAALLFLLNRLSPTGCWRLWKEINDIHKAWLDEAVFSQAPSYNEALALVQSPAWKEKWNYK